MPVKLGELLLKENMVSPQQLQEALNHQKMSGGKLGKAFVSLGFVKDEEITSLLSRQYGVPSINLDHFEVDPAIIKIIPAETARKYQVLPLSRSGATLTIAMADPTNVFAMDDIKFMTGYNVEPVVASETALEDAIDKYYGSTRSLELRKDTAPAGGYQSPGGSTSFKEVMDGPTLSVDDMAAIGGLSEIDLDSMGDADAVVLVNGVEDRRFRRHDRLHVVAGHELHVVHGEDVGGVGHRDRQRRAGAAERDDLVLAGRLGGHELDHGRVDLELGQGDRGHAVLLGQQRGDFLVLHEAHLHEVGAELPPVLFLIGQRFLKLDRRDALLFEKQFTNPDRHD